MPQKARPRKKQTGNAGVTVWRPSIAPGQISRREQTRLIAFSNMANLFEHGQLKPLDRLPPEIACTVHSVTQGVRRNGDRFIRIRMRDKFPALKRLVDETLRARRRRTK